ncbi:hypothetical protein QJS04_geneDACA018023 [Acorus gramineus]|uniref:Uncharacterized protein n=1 Tax=Acorus gramineus TaxID=55184 RepID=A0AAV9AB23_ACOGR|nr:hypothetical protein QJS04_geneDACA018023 [Acorus gramineus]
MESNKNKKMETVKAAALTGFSKAKAVAIVGAQKLFAVVCREREMNGKCKGGR